MVPPRGFSTSIERALRPATLLPLFAGLFLAPEAALPGGSFEVDGSIRSIPLYVDNGSLASLPDFVVPEENQWYVQNRLRLTASGRTDGVLSRYEAHLVQSADYRSDPGGFLDEGTSVLGAAGGSARYRAADLDWEWLDEEEWSGSLSLDRLYFRLAFPRADLTVGRQAITFGKAHFWSVLDLFAPFDPREFDREYKRGVDAIRLDVPLGILSGVTLVGVAGDTLLADKSDEWSVSEAGSALVGRLFTRLFRFDVALESGKVYGGRTVGAGFVGEIATVELRGEWSRFDAGDGPSLPFPFEGPMLEDHQRAVFGVGRYFASGLLLEAEYLYNGLGDPDDLEVSLARVAAGHSYHMGRHIAGSFASYELLPIVTANLASIVSLSDGSWQLQPGLVWSTGDNSELLAGAIVGFGDEPGGGLAIDLRSEFGTYPDAAYVEWKWYF